MTQDNHFTILEQQSEAFTMRDTSRPVMLIGFQRQSNLGLGYLASVLRQHGYRVEVFDFEAERGVILEAAKSLNPILIGFSLIFQSYIFQFRALIQYLRDGGVDCHFTMGGHFPSLSYQRTLEVLPELDTVVRFEGEMTCLELADCLGTGRDWRSILGIAYHSEQGAHANEMRPLIHDLDQLPYPQRNFRRNPILGRYATPMLASRGCARTCSFCSIHMFYRTAPGKVVRTRKPAEVVKEMRYLLEQQGISIFLFQDDDFPLFGPVWRRWAGEFVDELHRNQMPGRVVWKINCRADAVEPQLFRRMREAGLYMVYMGLESGTEQGLKTLHKQINVEQNLRAVEVLKSIDALFEYGFMLLDPSSTFDSVRANVQFLRKIVGDGSAGASFGRMVPYDGTPIKDELEREGRLRGDVRKPDYDFLDPRLTDFYDELVHIVDVTGWIHGYRALTPQLNFAWDEVAILKQLFPGVPDLPAYEAVVRRITRDSNEILFKVVEGLCDVFSDGAPNNWSMEELQAKSREFVEELEQSRNDFVFRNQNFLLETLERQGQAVCA